MIRTPGEALVTCASLMAGFALGYSLAASNYKDDLLSVAQDYEKTVQASRIKEQEWRERADQLESEYQHKLNAIRTSNDAALNELRQQLAKASYRVSKDHNTTSKSDAEAREARVSKEIQALAEFSDRCSRRTDELILQVKGLQDWITEVSK